MNSDADSILEVMDRAVEEHPDSRRLEAEFARLAEEWKTDTEFVSSVTDNLMHPAYQRIIGMGFQAVPLLLRELRDRPHHWFWALRCISGEEPASFDETSSFEDVRQGWLAWGRKHGWIG